MSQVCACLTPSMDRFKKMKLDDHKYILCSRPTTTHVCRTRKITNSSTMQIVPSFCDVDGHGRGGGHQPREHGGHKVTKYTVVDVSCK